MNNSMINPSITELLEKVEDREYYGRAATEITTNKSKKPLTLAIHEVEEGAVSYHKNEEVTE